MRFVKRAGIGLLLACTPLGGIGCASLPNKLSSIPVVSRKHSAADEYRLALSAEKQKDYAKARDLYASLQKKSPEIPLYAHRMGVVSTQLGDHVTASKYFEHARKLDPNNASLLTDMGYSAILQQDYVQAEGLLTKAVKLQPENARAVNNLALAIGYQGRFDESLATFRKINSEGHAQANLGYVHIQRGEQPLAIDCYRRAISRDPNNKSHATMLAQLEQQVATGIVPPAQIAVKPAAPATKLVASLAEPFADVPLAATLTATEVILDTSTPSLSATAEPPLVHASEFLAPEIHDASTASTPATRRAAKESASRPRDRVPAEEELPFFEDTESESHADAMAQRDQASPEFQPPMIVPEGSFVSHIAASQVNTRTQTASLEVSSLTEVTPPREVQKSTWDSNLTHVAHSSAPKPLSRDFDQSDDLASVFDDDNNRPEAKSDDTEELTGLEWVKGEQATLAANSSNPATGFVELADGLKGFCPVAIRDDRRLTLALDEFTYEHQSQVYRFSSAEALAKFQANPELYAPMAGGLDVVAVRQGAAVANGSLDHAVWFRHRLHLFSTVENLATFRAAPRTFAAVQ